MPPDPIPNPTVDYQQLQQDINTAVQRAVPKRGSFNYQQPTKSAPRSRSTMSAWRSKHLDAIRGVRRVKVAMLTRSMHVTVSRIDQHLGHSATLLNEKSQSTMCDFAGMMRYVNHHDNSAVMSIGRTPFSHAQPIRFKTRRRHLWMPAVWC